MDNRPQRYSKTRTVTPAVVGSRSFKVSPQVKRSSIVSAQAKRSSIVSAQVKRSSIVRAVSLTLVFCLLVSLPSCSSCVQAIPDPPVVPDQVALLTDESIRDTISDTLLVEVQESETELVVWPLTGLPTSGTDDIYRRPLSIKLENTPEARPQLGISHADIVYESITEGGITRFNCIFHSDIPVEVGPVRSARNSDVSIIPQYQALFFYSGANSTVNREIAAAGISNMSDSAAPSLYYRVNYRYAPHNLYLYLNDCYTVAANKGFKTQVEDPPSLLFGPSSHASAVDARVITVPLSYSYTAIWDYDAASNTYSRSMGGTKTTDAENSQVVSASNIVVLWAPHTLGVIANNSQTLNIDLTTSGAASIFFGGKRIDGTWEASANTPPRFKDADGNEILLTPGKTWFEVVNTNIAISAS